MQPRYPVRVELTTPKSVADDFCVVHLGDEKGADRVEAELSESGKVCFAAQRFSVYAVVDEGDDYEEARMTLEFYNGGSEPFAVMYVKNKDTEEELNLILYDPGVGGALEEGETFSGWILDKPDYTTADLDSAMSIKQLREWAEAKDIEEGEVHRLDAAISKLYHIYYQDDDINHTTLGMVSIPVKSSGYGTDSVSYTVNQAYTLKDDVHNFEGWRVNDESVDHITSNVPDDRIYQNGTDIEVNGDVTFTVNAPEGNWLIFDENGKGAKYNAPQFVKSGEVTREPCPDTDMVRNGYTFGGWYDTKEHADAHAADPSADPPVTEGEFKFGKELTAKTTIYASWIPNETAPYTVIFWTQNQDRTAYEVAGSVALTGTVGENIAYRVVENKDEDYVTGPNGTDFGDYGHYTGFCLKDADKNQQVKITPEGDAVLNLHYDRIQYNLRFYLYRKGNGNNSYRYAQNSNRGKNVWGIATWYDETSLSNMPTTTYGTIHSDSVDGYTGYYFVLSAYYGEDISSKWPEYSQIRGPENNRSPVSYIMMNGTGLKGNGIDDNGYGSGKDTIKGLITIMDEKILGLTNDADGNYLIVRFNTYNDWRYHIWYETVEGEDYTGQTTHTYNSKTYYEMEDSPIEVRSSNTDVDQQNPPQYSGYEYVGRRNENWNGDGRWTTNNPTRYHINYIYDRLEYKINYFDGNYVNGNGGFIQNRATHLLHKSDSINQGALIPDADKNYVPDAPEDGYWACAG